MAFVHSILTFALLPTGICAFFCILGIVLGKGIPSEGAGWAAIAFPIILILRWHIKSSTTCPKCKKSFVTKKINREDMGVSSNAYRKKVGETFHTFEKHRYLDTYKCSSCGHEYQKTVEEERRLD